jgi:phosphoadenosine phosphosulfate reductase
MCYFCIVIYQTYRVIDLLINNNRMSSAIAKYLVKTKNFSDWNSFLLASEFKDKVVFSTSFGQEDQVLTSLIANNDRAISIFTLDTGRLFQETYDVFIKR